MKKLFPILIFLFFSIMSCTEESTDLKVFDLSEYNLKIIPEKPSSAEEIKLVVFEDCTYNVLSGVTKNGKTIEIRKTFNSMMKWPCVMTNDTILIGKLQEGTYTVNYKLMDTSPQVADPVSFSVTFRLEVTK